MRTPRFSGKGPRALVIARQRGAQAAAQRRLTPKQIEGVLPQMADGTVPIPRSAEGALKRWMRQQTREPAKET